MTSDTYGVNPLAPDAPRRPTPQSAQGSNKTFGRRPWPKDGETQAGGGGSDTIAYDGRAGRLFGMGMKIAILTLLSLGFYRFWGKTEVRRYLWSRISFMGNRFEYTGTGKELFFGFLIALAVLIPLGGASVGIEMLMFGKSAILIGIVSFLKIAVILYLIGYATFRARRYRLSRTVFRGIRFWQTGSNVGYALRMLGYFTLTIVTLGLARPIGDIALHRYLMQHTWFGSQKFEFDGLAGKMAGRWILSYLLVPFTLGLSLLWYSAFKMRYLVGHTRYQGLSLSLPVTFGNLCRIYFPYFLVLGVLAFLFSEVLGAMIDPELLKDLPKNPRELWTNQNFLIVYGTTMVAAIAVFGLFAPALQLVILTHRFIRLVSERLELHGDIDLDAVMQNAAQAPQSGEGLADALDIGGGLEVGI